MNDFGTSHGAQLARFFGATLIAVLASMPTFMFLFMIGAGIDSLFGAKHSDFSGLSDFLMWIGPAMLFSFVGVIIFPVQLLGTFILTFVAGAAAAGWPRAVFRMKRKWHWVLLGSVIGLLVGSSLIGVGFNPATAFRSNEIFPILVISLITG